MLDENLYLSTVISKAQEGRSGPLCQCALDTLCKTEIKSMEFKNLKKNSIRLMYRHFNIIKLSSQQVL